MLAHCVVSTYDRLPPSAPVLELLDPVLELLDCLTMKRKMSHGAHQELEIGSNPVAPRSGRTFQKFST